MLISALAWISAVLVASLLTWWSYRYWWSSGIGWKIATISRWIAIFIVVLWLFNPKFLVEKSEVIPPRYDVYVDVSASNKDQYEQVISFLDSWKIANKGIEVRLFAFAEQVLPINQFNLLGGNQTRLDRVYEHIQLQQNRTNLRVIISDGIENQGRPIQSFGANNIGPVVVLGTGDTTVYPDAKIKELLVNKEVYQGNSTEAEAVIEANNLKNQSLKIIWKINDQIVQEQFWSPLTPKEQKRLAYVLKAPAKKSDWLNLQVQVVPLATEKNRFNNAKVASIRVRDNKKVVQVIYGAPHPDIKAIRLALKDKDAYDIRISNADEVLNQDADVLVVHQIRNTNLMTTLLDQRTPIWWFTSEPAVLNRLLASEESSALRKGLNGTQEVLPAVNERFGLFELPPTGNVLKYWKSVNSPYLVLNRATEKVQLWQIWGGKSTNVPLMYTDKQGERHQHVFLGSGIWQWRMNEMRLNSNAENFDNWVSRNIQYLSRVAEGKKGWEFLGAAPSVSVGDRLKLKWQYVDAAGELSVKNGVNAFIKIKDKMIRLPLHVENKTYVANWTASEAGPIQVWLQEGKGPNVGNGSFYIQPFSQELEESRASHTELMKFANNSGGFFSDFRNRETMASKVEALGLQKGLIKTTKEWLPLEEWWWVMTLLIGLISLEWMLRKWLGKL